VHFSDTHTLTHTHFRRYLRKEFGCAVPTSEFKTCWPQNSSAVHSRILFASPGCVCVCACVCVHRPSPGKVHRPRSHSPLHVDIGNLYQIRMVGKWEYKTLALGVCFLQPCSGAGRRFAASASRLDSYGPIFCFRKNEFDEMPYTLDSTEKKIIGLFCRISL